MVEHSWRRRSKRNEIPPQLEIRAAIAISVLLSPSHVSYNVVFKKPSATHAVEVMDDEDTGRTHVYGNGPSYPAHAFLDLANQEFNRLDVKRL